MRRGSPTGSACCSPSTSRSASTGCCIRALYDYFLPFKALRVPARMGLMVGFSLAVLAGYGAARLAGRSAVGAGAPACAGRRPRRLMLVEYASKPLAVLACAARARRQIYADLVRDRGDSPTAVLFEFPTASLDDPAYLYYSTFHWQSLVNGYSGFFPPSYLRLVCSDAELSRRAVDGRDQVARRAIPGHSRRVAVAATATRR